jgi:thioesterase domain-containing protein
MYQNKEDSEREFLLDNWATPLPPEYLQVLAANFQAGKDYVGKFYAGNVTLFRSDIQPLNQSLHPDLGWEKLVGGSLTIHAMQGHHNNLLKEPYIKILAEKLDRCLV